MNGKHELASIIILLYNSKNDLAECIPSLLNQTYTNYEIIIVDNASTDGSAEFIKTNCPAIKLIETGDNLGYSAGNNAGFKHANGEYIVVINPDIVADNKWLEELIKPLENNPEITLTTPKILIYHKKDRVNACANITHYTGLGFCRGLNESAKNYTTQQTVGAISGCSFAIRRDMLDYIGGFDSDFYLYLEDADISWRARLAGGKIVYTSKSIIYHKYKLSVSPPKHFYLECNRYQLLMKNLRTKTLILILPGLALSEVVTMGYAIMNGPDYVKSKLKAYSCVFKNINRIRTKRHEGLEKRMISENEFFKQLDWRIPFEQVIEYRWMLWCANVLFNTFYRVHYWIVCKLI